MPPQPKKKFPPLLGRNGKGGSTRYERVRVLAPKRQGERCKPFLINSKISKNEAIDNHSDFIFYDAPVWGNRCGLQQGEISG